MVTAASEEQAYLVYILEYLTKLFLIVLTTQELMLEHLDRLKSP